MAAPPPPLAPPPPQIPELVTKVSSPSNNLHDNTQRQCAATESDPVIIGAIHDADAKRLRIVHISDTHMKHDSYLCDIPHGDILIHSGDFTNHWESQRQRPKEAFLQDMRNLNTFFSKLPHKHKIFVAGNHEVTFNPYANFKQQIQEQFIGVTYLQDRGVDIEGLTFYGSPWTSSSKMAFSTWELGKYWDRIPGSTDVLITHMPPRGVMDLAFSSTGRIRKEGKCRVCGKEKHNNYSHWGCSELLDTVLTRVRPIIHLFGHVHDCHGVKTKDGILFSNGAMDLLPKANVIDLYYIQKSQTANHQQEKLVTSDDTVSMETKPHKRTERSLKKSTFSKIAAKLGIH